MMLAARLALLLAVLVPLMTAQADPGVAEPQGYRLDNYRAPVPDTVAGAEVLHLSALRDRIGRQNLVLIDVLPASRRPEGMRPGIPWLPLPHRSLPDSLWWPGVGRGEIPPALDARFRQRLGEIAGVGAPLIVFFCLNDCWMGWNATKRAASYGFHVAWYPEGADTWEAVGLPVQAVEPELLAE
jgi:PQQ-dependent catabolism-associated CXXCW motif protein